MALSLGNGERGTEVRRDFRATVLCLSTRLEVPVVSFACLRVLYSFKGPGSYLKWLPDVLTAN